MIANRPPDVVGVAGRAWNRCDVEPGNVDQTASVGAWIVHLPASHPYWPTYLFAVVHLRPIDGQSRPPTLRYPEAQYEFLVAALHPEGHPPDHPLNVDDRESWRHLTPINICEHFDFGPSSTDTTRDVMATELLRFAVLAAVNGHRGVEPDDDGGCREWWRHAIRNTTDHALGLHEGRER